MLPIEESKDCLLSFWINKLYNHFDKVIIGVSPITEKFVNHVLDFNIKDEDIKNFNDSEKFNYLLSKFNYADTKVALLCNHQKGISKNFDEQINKIKNKIKDLRKKKKKAKSTDKQKQYSNKILLEKSKLETKTKMKKGLKNTLNWYLND